MSTIAIEIPPLRQRPGDIELLARHFVTALNDRFGCSKRIGGEALERLRAHQWPGNVRELLHAVEAAMVVCEAEEILPEHLPAPLRNARAPQHLATLDEMERQHIRSALDACHGHRSQAAKLLGISERNLYRKLKEYGFE